MIEKIRWQWFVNSNKPWSGDCESPIEYFQHWKNFEGWVEVVLKGEPDLVLYYQEKWE